MGYNSWHDYLDAIMMYKKTLFISDLHLEANRPDITEQFLTLLKQCDTSIDALYILGDLFETWIGDDDDDPFHRRIMQALREATEKGLSIFFLHGNRDFLIGRHFLKVTGCKLLADEEKIMLYGTSVLVIHGDTLCTRDSAYLRWRKISHHPLLRALFSLSPLFFRKWLARYARAKSAVHTQKISNDVMDVVPEEVERVMKKHEVQYLIHGHTHKPCIHDFTLNGANAVRIVLGAWHECGNMLIWDNHGKKDWVEMQSALHHL